MQCEYLGRECGVCDRIGQEWHIEKLLEDLGEAKFACNYIKNNSHTQTIDIISSGWERTAKFEWERQAFTEEIVLARNIYRGLSPKEKCIIYLFLKGYNVENIQKYLHLGDIRPDLSRGIYRWMRFLTSKDFGNNANFIRYYLQDYERKLTVWEQLWQLSQPAVIENHAKYPAMFPRVVTSDLDMIQPYIEIPDKSSIEFVVDLKIDGNLLLLEKGPSQKIWCLCPSRLAPNMTIESTREMMIPQPENKGRKLKEKGAVSWVNQGSLKVSGKGTENILAVVSPREFGFTWLDRAKKPEDAPAISLDEENLSDVLTHITNSDDCQVFSMSYEVT